MARWGDGVTGEVDDIHGLPLGFKSVIRQVNPGSGVLSEEQGWWEGRRDRLAWMRRGDSRRERVAPWLW